MGGREARIGDVYASSISLAKLRAVFAFSFEYSKSHEVAEAVPPGPREMLVLIEKGLPDVLQGCRNGVWNCFRRVAFAFGKVYY